MYAIFRAKGKQFRAVPDATIRIPTLDAAPGDQVTFDEVLLTARDGDVRVGAPSLDGAAVSAEIVSHGRDDKIIVYKMKRRKGYRRKQGHRQGYTEIRILDIAFPTGKADTPSAKKAETGTADRTARAEAQTEVPVEADITPAARELAEAHGIELASIEGTGKGGRILKSDIDRAIKEREGE